MMRDVLLIITGVTAFWVAAIYLSHLNQTDETPRPCSPWENVNCRGKL